MRAEDQKLTRALVEAGIYEHPKGMSYWRKIALVDLPYNDIGLDDLERFGIELCDAAGSVR
jgi:hypothetical protein